MSLKSKHSVHVCFFLPSPPGSYYQMTIYSRRRLGKRFHKHQDFKSRKGCDEHGGCMSWSFWLPFPILACVPCSGFAFSPAKQFEVQEPLGPALQPRLGEGRAVASGLGCGSRGCSWALGMCLTRNSVFCNPWRFAMQM